MRLYKPVPRMSRPAYQSQFVTSMEKIISNDPLLTTHRSVPPGFENHQERL
jgi:hypothetical protein